MRTKRRTFSQKYLSVLQQYLEDNNADPNAARTLGRQAVSKRLETLDLARIHEEAILKLVSPDEPPRSQEELINKGRSFFSIALAPIEDNHHGAREANSHLKTMNETLTKRTLDLAAINEELKNEILQRKAVEDSLRISELTSSQLLVKSRQMQEELRLLSRRLLLVQEEERKRISRDLHDVVAQTLTGINVRLAALKSQTTANSKDLGKKIGLTQRIVEKSVDMVHRFARDLRPTVLDDLGLIPALRSYLKDFIERTGIRVELTVFAGVEKLDDARRIMFYRVAQEALTNVSRHSKASHAAVSIRQDNGSVWMEIHDNGQGFQVDEAVTKGSQRLGLLGMRERVEMVGGTFHVSSAAGRETIIRAEISKIDSIKSK